MPLTVASATDARLTADVLAAIKQDPFIGILETRRLLNRKGDSESIGRWEVFQVLRRQRLLSRRSRFRWVRKLYQQ